MRARLPKKVLAFALCLALGVSSTLVAIADEEVPTGMVIAEPIADVSEGNIDIIGNTVSDNSSDIKDVSDGNITSLLGKKLADYLAEMEEGQALADILVSLSEEQYNSLEGFLTEADWYRYAAIVDKYYSSEMGDEDGDIPDYNSMDVVKLWDIMRNLTDDGEYFRILNSLSEEKRAELDKYVEMVSTGEYVIDESNAVNFAGAAPLFLSTASAVVPRNFLRSRAVSSEFNAIGNPEADGVEISKALVEYDSSTGLGKLELDAFVTGTVYTQMSTKPVDIVLVLDQSGSMAKEIGNKGYYKKDYTNDKAFENRNSLYVMVDDNYYKVVISRTSFGKQYTVSDALYYSDLVEGDYYILEAGEYYKLDVKRSWNGFRFKYTISYMDKKGTKYNIVNDASNNTIRRTVYELTESYSYMYGYAQDENYFGSSSGANGLPPTDLYLYTTQNVERLTALQDAVRQFVNSVETNSIKSDGTKVDHRIAIAGFACNTYGSTNYKNSEILTGVTIQTGKQKNNGESQFFPMGYEKNGVLYNTTEYNLTVKRNALQSVLSDSGKTSINNAIDALTAYGGTRTDQGLNMAEDIFKAQDNSYQTAYANDERKKVVVVFTDGQPGMSGFDEDVANAAISKAKSLKDTGTVIYTVGIFDGDQNTDGANGKINSNKVPESFEYTAEQRNNRFLHLVSSNYLNATGLATGDRQDHTATGPINPNLTWLDPSDHSKGYNSYYLSANNADGLNNVFQAISQEIGGASANLDETTVVQDVISDYFSGITSDNIKVYLENCTAVNEFGGETEYVFDSANREDVTNRVKIDIQDGKIIQVSGFDFTENYVGLRNGVPGGKRLVIEVDIQYDGTASFGGNNIPTNKPTSGVYNAGGDTCYGNFEEPTANYRIDYEAAAEDQTIYVTNQADLSNAISYVNGYAPDGIKNSFVDIVYTLKAKNGSTLGTFTIEKGKTVAEGVWNWISGQYASPEQCTEYTLECIVTPEIPDELSTGDPAEEKVITGLAPWVHVLYPTIKCSDEMIFWGDKTEDLAARCVKENWFDGIDSHIGIPAVQGTEPILTLEVELVRGSEVPATGDYRPDLDSDFNVLVKIGGKNITEYSNIITAKSGNQDIAHNGCIEPSLNDEDHDFTIHVIDGEIYITKVIKDYVKKNNDGDPVFTFKIDKMDGDKVIETFYRAVRFNDNSGTKDAEVLSGLKKGTYRVTELSALKYTLTDVADGGGSCRGTQGEESIIFEIGKTLENRIGKATFTNIRSGNDKPTDKDVVVNRFVYDEKTGEYVIKQIIVPGAGQEEQNAWPNSRSN